ncbi:polysaccharide deacetylase family protein [Stakelama tenebrarum]|uniref:WalW protein n=1 Tax=Stakelama tenebrarum TaxID=2711215 RepID=A0A6G6Y5S1_9SPHN|nr:polysaccharide deacetylase family protein [Sphingosinithalassobacter tenebrarum]QIG79926.1 WalW protein [Sphingosinithalassobacter tenebrarum]
MNRFAAPCPTSAIAWPDDFGTRFTLFVDTEEEFDWTGPFRREARDTSAAAAIPEFHRRFADRHIPVAYMVDHPIATDPAAIDAVREVLDADPRATVGTQLHPWVNPPFDEDVNVHNSFAGNLPRALEAAKLSNLTETIEASFGVRPIVYRAGRYGLGPHTLGMLEDLGYRIDSSMRATYDFSHMTGPDYSAVGNDAFRAGPTGALIELPLTTVFTGHARGAGRWLHPLAQRMPFGGALSRLGLLSRIALTPEDMPVDEVLEAIRIALGEGVRVLNFSYHSPSIVPGHTPYVRDAADLAEFNRWWDEVLDLLDRLGVRAASIDDLVAAAE